MERWFVFVAFCSFRADRQTGGQDTIYAVKCKTTRFLKKDLEYNTISVKHEDQK